jgi:quercetin dioxygenase-like cupin family protein
MASRAHVLRPHELPTVDRGGGVRTVALVTARLGARQFLNGITEFDPGASLPMHSHDCEESVVVLEGRAAFEDEEGTVEMAPLDTTWVPAGTVHRFSNRGEGRMRILWTYGSASATRTLAETGETFAVGSPAEHAGASR